MLNSVLEYYRTHRDEQLAGLVEFLKIPSMSAVPSAAADVQRAARHLADELIAIGFQNVEVLQGEPSEHPLIKGELISSADKPTVLLYGHCDVQPIDPIALWDTPPFEPTVRDGKLFARGAADDKGQLWILAKAIEGYTKTGSELPVNLKILSECEEEFTGAHISRYVNDYPEFLHDVTSALVLDTGMFERGLPTISTGLRGIITAEIHVHSASGDLHSGEFGGAAPNALQGLTEILASLKTRNGFVRIPDFYKSVRKPSPVEKHSWRKLPFDVEAYRRHIGARALAGLRRYSVLERLWALPTLEINGIAGGFAGDGFKTVIPSDAVAKVSMRLVPGMDADAIADAFEDFVAANTPDSVTSSVRILSAAPAMVVDTSDPAIAAAAEAFKQTFGADTAYVRSGGSIPIAGAFKEVLDVPVLITGFTLPDCNMHAPNENLVLDNFYAGIEAIGRYFALLGK